MARWTAPTLREFATERAAEPRGRVVFGARGRSFGVDRAAGVALVQRQGGAAPTWSGEPGNFNGDGWGGAFWMLGTDLFVSSGARLLADLRAELSPAGATEPPALAATARDQWSDAVLAWLEAKARENLRARSASTALVDGAPPYGDTVQREWLRVAVWYTYLRDATPRVDGVRLPRDLLVPAMGASLGTSPALTGVYRGFVLDAANREGFETSAFMGPFPGQVIRADEIDVGGSTGGGGGTLGGNGSGGGGDSSGTGALLGLGLVALLAGESK